VFRSFCGRLAEKGFVIADDCQSALESFGAGQAFEAAATEAAHVLGSCLSIKHFEF
jgi:hypothetical protein